MSKTIVVIDAGHGYKPTPSGGVVFDSGAIGYLGQAQHREADIAAQELVQPLAQGLWDGDAEPCKVIKDFQQALRGVPERDELACQHQHLREVAHLAMQQLAPKPDEQYRPKRNQVRKVLTRDFACGSLRKQSSRDAQQSARGREQQVRLDQRGERTP